MDKLISVIMSTFNETNEDLRCSIESILNQTYNNFELLIVDDNPNNSELANCLSGITDSRVRIIYNKENIGLVNSLNIALKVCKGQYIARMDADDISLKNRLQEQLYFLEAGNYDMVGSSIEMIDENGYHIKNEYIPNNSNILVHKLKIKNILPHPTWFCRKELYDDLNGYRNVPGCEDYDFILRAIKARYKIGGVHTILLKYMIRANGITQSHYSEQYVLSKYLRKAIGNNMPIENIEHYIKSLDYLNSVSAYKEFKQAKDNLKSGSFNCADILKVISNEYIFELLKDKFF